MKNKGILVVSFGTTHKKSIEKTIAAVESKIEECYPDYVVKRAFTSSMIIKTMASRGEAVSSVTQALGMLLAQGVTEVYIQPTHIIAGDEYEKLIKFAMNFRDRFEVLKIGKPLLCTMDDMFLVADIVSKNIEAQEDEALVFMGHGTEHPVNTVYAAMDYIFKERGCKNIFMGTVEAYPSLENVAKMVKNSGYKKVALSPFMLVAGDHATNDMASDDEESWKTYFESMGMETRVIMKGLGEYLDIQEMYLEHIKRYLHI
ncbi:MAG: sirohydrochlorin cobaltochelatase [Anaerotignaceae bacterium]